jgi:hypothetical protein
MVIDIMNKISKGAHKSALYYFQQYLLPLSRKIDKRQSTMQTCTG